MHILKSSTTTKSPNFQHVYVEHLERQSVGHDDVRLKLKPHLVALNDFRNHRQKVQASPLLTEVADIIRKVKHQSRARNKKSDKILQAGDTTSINEETSEFSRILQSNHLLSPVPVGDTAPQSFSSFSDGARGSQSFQKVHQNTTKQTIVGDSGFVDSEAFLKKEKVETSNSQKWISSDDSRHMLPHASLPDGPPKPESVHILQNEVILAVDGLQEAEIRPNKSRVVFKDDDLLHDEDRTARARDTKTSRWRNPIRIFEKRGILFM